MGSREEVVFHNSSGQFLGRIHFQSASNPSEHRAGGGSHHPLRRCYDREEPAASGWSQAATNLGWRSAAPLLPRDWATQFEQRFRHKGSDPSPTSESSLRNYNFLSFFSFSLCVYNGIAWLVIQVSQPKLWKASTGAVVEVDTAEIEHLRDTRIMYEAICSSTLTEDRVRALHLLKRTVYILLLFQKREKNNRYNYLLLATPLLYTSSFLCIKWWKNTKSFIIHIFFLL